MSQSQQTPVEPTEFIFVICQNGAESAAKLEIMTNHPNLKLSFSRPGFITFKVEPGSMALRFNLKSTLARSYGWSLGRCTGEVAEQMADEIVKVDAISLADRIHVFERDPLLPGKNGFEPGVSPLANEIGEMLAVRLQAKSPKPAPVVTSESPTKAASEKSTDEVPSDEADVASAAVDADSADTAVQPVTTKLARSYGVNQVARADQLVFDVVMVEPGQWWYGFHYANTTAGRWVGGAPTFDTSKEVYSRAYFKLKEALLWSGITIQPGDVCAEIGSAPGGACQLLLEAGATVIGIDPAEMEDEVLKHENMTHIRRKANEVKKRDFKPVKWLIVDVNTDPGFTLDVAEEIAKYEEVSFTGMVLTLKMLSNDFYKQVPPIMARMKSLGFQVVKLRQLAFNRRECCLVAIKKKFVLRDQRRK